MFSLLFVSLLASALILAHYLREKSRLLNERVGYNVYSPKRETCVVIAILLVFDLSYASRVVYEFGPYTNREDNIFASYMIS